MIRKTSPIQVVGYGIGSKKEIFPRDGKQLNCHSLFSSFLSVQVSLYLVKKSVKSFEGFLGSFLVPLRVYGCLGCFGGMLSGHWGYFEKIFFVGLKSL